MDIGGSALVTGASRGIGRAVAFELAQRGFDTVATMRDPDTAGWPTEPHSGRLNVERLDVTDPDTYRLPPDLRVLVNNAGLDGDGLPVEHADLAAWRRVFETNVFGVVGLTSAAIPTLRSNAPSVICSITSSSILAAVPFYATYRASKAAVSATNDSLRVEVAPFGIRVVEILPGPVDTDMFRSSTAEPEAARFERYRGLTGVATSLRRQHADPRVIDPAAAAKRIVDAILDDAGPMRYGCDPLADELMELWRRHDDETVYALTGQSLLEEVAREPGPGDEGAPQS
jgi:NAD(P)-dependent dehydrogenase (short-subunit alcohol dehydrogenase family)